MATMFGFAPAEWKKVVQSPLLAGFAVSAADPSGFIGLLQEAFAAARSLSEARAQAGDALIRAVAEELLTSTGRAEAREGVRTIAQGASLDDIKRGALDAMKEVGAIVDSKAGEHARPFKEWLAQVARMVAEAGLEDTFLGFGGIRMSEKERAALHEISQALGIEAAAPSA
ncbi:hypothetical protein [Methylocystis parvus]|uniref:Uncharacterized protein n=1 Tax=Methylocystis parvus TaxID=134 RepID=A0A6B8M931_9HYPH|nr:hypothetical protein [Methylocystis parvus]QGM97230.1 hypothetical protein F7D14_06885 [Methylocystis parvus]WBJ98863.1 hypothetical protein MMG94_12730 [Methylocystis parvus OBBP]